MKITCPVLLPSARSIFLPAVLLAALHLVRAASPPPSPACSPGLSPGTDGQPKAGRLPGPREEADIRQEWLRLRLDEILPVVMRKYGIQMWVVISREYNEDPVFFSLVSADTFSARRRSMLVFFDRGGKEGVERLTIGHDDSGGLYRVIRDAALQKAQPRNWQWALLRKLVEERQPASIAINVSANHAFADGLTVSEKEALEDSLGSRWMARLVRAENLPVEYLYRRLPGMLPHYRELMKLVHELIGRAFSGEVITPGVTTTTDVVWWFRQQIQDRGLGVWFQPTVDLQRAGLKEGSSFPDETERIILPGDVLHMDLGIVAMGLATDTQHMGYVLKPGESQPPPGLLKVLQAGRRLQELVMERLRPGRSGNEILLDSLAAMRQEGIDGSIYCHPVGDHGHGAGPIIGLWDRQEAIPVRGDLLVLPDSWFAIELAAGTAVPEWDGQVVRVGLEENAVVNGFKAEWVFQRQERFHLIPSKSGR